MSDFEDDIDDQLLELAGATEKKKKKRQPSSSNNTGGGGSGGNKKRKAEYALFYPILLDILWSCLLSRPPTKESSALSFFGNN